MISSKQDMGVPPSGSGHSPKGGAASSTASPAEPSTPNAAFTSGPWGICHNGECSCKSVWCDDHPIAEVVHGAWGDDYPALRFIETDGLSGTAVEAYMEQITYGEIDDATAKANGRLIASAPSLFAALQYARNLVGPDEVVDAALALAINGDLEREAKMQALFNEMMNRTFDHVSASAIEARQRQDAEERPDPKGESAVPPQAGDAQ
jgi:hypothetical protein